MRREGLQELWKKGEADSEEVGGKGNNDDFILFFFVFLPFLGRSRGIWRFPG